MRRVRRRTGGGGGLSEPWHGGGVVEWWWWSYLSRNVSEILRSARAIEASIAGPLQQCCFCRGADR